MSYRVYPNQRLLVAVGLGTGPLVMAAAPDVQCLGELECSPCLEDLGFPPKTVWPKQPGLYVLECEYHVDTTPDSWLGPGETETRFEEARIVPATLESLDLFRGEEGIRHPGWLTFPDRLAEREAARKACAKVPPLFEEDVPPPAPERSAA